MKSASVKCVGVFLMPSVLVALEESLSSLSQWRAAISGRQHIAHETTDHLPLKSLLLPLACVAVFETKLSPTPTKRYVLKLILLETSTHKFRIKDVKTCILR